MSTRTVPVLLALVLVVQGCTADESRVCVPKSNRSCQGVSGCIGTQTCSDDGLDYSACACAATDAGEVADSGPALTDAGLESQDSGPTPTDGGTVPIDSGVASPDASTIADGGFIPDASTPPVDGGSADAGGGGFPQPAGTTPISFCVDDTANQTYRANDGLAWKGSFSYASTTRILNFDAAWSGPYPPVYDDGPYTAGGHEPIGQTAGDHIWCITAFTPTPSRDITFEYGAEDSLGWIWPGPNGTFVAAGGATQEIYADPLVIAPHGTIDLRLTLDTNAVAPSWGVQSGGSVRVKGPFVAWREVDLVDNGTGGDVTPQDGVYTMVLSTLVGPGTLLHNYGLLRAGVASPFVFVLNGVEYKGSVPGHPGFIPLTTGVGAEIRSPGGAWTPTTIFYDLSELTAISP